MAYLFQTFVFKNVLTAAQMNQVEVNVRDHVHGTAGIVTVPDTGLSANAALKNIDNAFSADQTISKVNARLVINATTGIPIAVLKAGGVSWSSLASIALNQFNFLDSAGLTRAQWDLSTNPGTLVIGNIPDARLTANIPLLNAANTFTGDLTVSRSNPQININAIASIPVLDFSIDSVVTVRLRTALTNQFEIQSSTGFTRVQWDLSTNPGTLVVGSIPDARLTANVALKNIDNAFSVDQTISKASPSLNINAVTGNSVIRLQSAGVTTAAIASLATDQISFSDDIATRVVWDLSGTNGKLTQGDVPWARLEKSKTTNSNASASSILVVLPTLVLGDIVIINYFATATKSSIAGVLSYIISRDSGSGLIKYGGIQLFSENTHYAPASTSIKTSQSVIGVVTTAGIYTLKFEITGALTATTQVLQIEVRILTGT